MLHNQQSPTWRLISTNPLLLYMLDFEPSWTWKISHLHLQSWRPTETEQELSFSLVTPFVNMSTGFWLVCIVSIFNCPSSKVDRMKWYLNCIFLVFEWKAEFFARWMALWLSQYNLLFSYFFPNSSINLCNQIISLLASVAATYYASVVESETTFCSFEIQLTVVPPIVRRYHVVLLLLSLSPAIS